jgi:vacuolar-type H+-ATPase subunit E/Vma4
MRTEAEDIEMLKLAILTEAREEGEQMVAEARDKVNAIHRRAQEQAESERRAILDRANQDAERLRSQANATAQLKARSSQLEHREKLLDSVFEEVKKQLGGVKSRPDYNAIAMMLAREALTQLKVDQAELRADEATQKALRLDELSKELSGQFSFGGKLEEGTGVVVSASGGKLHYDNTLETRLSRLQGALRSAVYKVLMGESA